MKFSKTNLVMALAALSLGLSACSETKKEETLEAEAKEMATQAKEKSSELYDKAKDGASDMADKASDMAGDVKDKAADAYDEVKDKASDAYDATAEKASDAMDSIKDKAADVDTDEAAEKLKEACIATKKKLGQDPSDC